MADASKSTDDSTAQATDPSTEKPGEASADTPSDAPSGTSATAKPAAVTRARDATAPPERKARGGAGAAVKAGTDAVRTRIASLVWLLAVICALFLAVGALLIALKANRDNAIVQVILDGANKLDGPFNPANGIFKPSHHHSPTEKFYLLNWGIAAVIYLVIGRILDRVIRP